MKYSYKQLFPTDVPFLKALLKVFGEAFNDVSTYQDAVPSDTYLRSLLGEKNFIVVVAQDETGNVVAGLAAYELRKFEQARSEIYIYDLAVDERHRRKGIATALIKTLQGIAKARRAYVIFVQADQDDHPAIKLYESRGIRENVHHFDVPVPKD